MALKFFFLALDLFSTSPTICCLVLRTNFIIFFLFEALDECVNELFGLAVVFFFLFVVSRIFVDVFRICC